METPRNVQWLADDGSGGNPAGEWGKSRFFIVPPLTCREFSRGEPLKPKKASLFGGSFDSADEAFDTQFGVCRRAITNRINARNAPFPG